MAFQLPPGVVPHIISDSDNEPDMAPPQPTLIPRHRNKNQDHNKFDFDAWFTAYSAGGKAKRMENKAPRTVRKESKVSDDEGVSFEMEDTEMEDQVLVSGADLLQEEWQMQELAMLNMLTEDDCLQRILEIFPDIAHDHVLESYRAKFTYGIETPELSTVTAWRTDFVNTLIESGKYPKERERRQELKRKREDSNRDDATEFEKENREAVDQSYLNAAQRLLQDEFPQVPVKFIREKLRKHQFLIKAYAVIEAAERNLDTGQQQRSYRKVRARAPRPALTENLATMTNGALARELAAARRRREQQEAKRRKDAEKAHAERKNEEHARRNEAMSECGCCFTEYPTNRMIYCNGDTIHFFCQDCAANYVNAEVGQSKCRPKCMDTSGCGADFSRGQLMSFLDRKTFDKLENLQQQEDIRNAGLKDLAECPFCDFKAILPPIHVDREFRCHNTECEKISCRLCKLETHIPLTCEQNAKERKGSVRHAVEEAMSEALIRSCNRCKNKFVKDWGCNKMACTSCGNRQCYVCSQDVHDYQHFGVGRCPLYDDTDARHDDEVKTAEAEALKKVRVENPDMTEDELKVKVSDAVKAQERQARERRRQQNPDADILARAHGGGHMMVHGMAFADPQGVPHVLHPQVVPPPFIPEAFGPALYGMPQPFQVPHWVGGGAPHGPMPMMGPQQAAAHFYGVAPQPFENYPHVHNWANFMQQDMAHRHR